VRGHHRIGALLDAGTERRQFDRIKPRAVDANRRQTQVTVDVGVAVPRKMLDRRQHAALVRAVDVRSHE
jgi:hypothetical protein